LVSVKKITPDFKRFLYCLSLPFLIKDCFSFSQGKLQKHLGVIRSIFSSEKEAVKLFIGRICLNEVFRKFLIKKRGL